jgi:hypothetical protein
VTAEPESWICPSGGAVVEPERAALHEAGRDVRHPDCGRFDIRAFNDRPPRSLGERLFGDAAA